MISMFIDTFFEEAKWVNQVSGRLGKLLLMRHDYRNVFEEVIQMSEKWEPTEEQSTGPISRVSEFFIDELNELQEDLECPDEFIYDFMEAIRNRWSPDSCHSKARKLKREKPHAY